MKPVLYLLDDSGEAFDTVFFCSDSCRALYEADCPFPLKSGFNNEYIDNTVCDSCGEKL